MMHFFKDLNEVFVFKKVLRKKVAVASVFCRVYMALLVAGALLAEGELITVFLSLQSNNEMITH